MSSKILKISGTTLIEILVYFAIVGVITFVAITFSIQIANVSSLSTNYHELQSNADFVAYKLNTAIVLAQSIDNANSTFDIDNGSLSLNMADAQKSPTRFYFSDGDILLTEGNSDPVKLNSDLIKFDFLRFTKISSHKAPDQIIVEGQIHPTTADFANTNKIMTIHLTVSLRNL